MEAGPENLNTVAGSRSPEPMNSPVSSPALPTEFGGLPDELILAVLKYVPLPVRLHRVPAVSTRFRRLATLAKPGREITKEGNVFDCLPDEMVVEIFNRLPYTQPVLRRFISRVCARFRRLAKDPILNRSVGFHCRKSIPGRDRWEYARQYINDYSRSLQSITLHDADDGPDGKSLDYFLDTVDTFPKLTEFRLFDVMYIDQAYQEAAVIKCPAVTRLTLIGGFLKSFHALIDGWAPRLTHVQIHENCSRRETGAFDVYDSVVAKMDLAKVQSVQIWIVSRVRRMSEPHLKIFATSVTPLLTTVKLDADNATDEIVAILVDHAPNIATLRLLTANRLTDASLRSIGKLGQLSRLELTEAGLLTDEGIMGMFENLEDKLRRVTFSDVLGFDDVCVDMMLEFQANLKKCRIVGCRISEAGEVWLREAIPREGLYVSRNDPDAELDEY